MIKLKNNPLAKLATLVKFLLETEKTLKLLFNKRVYTFIVNKNLKKPQIKQLLEKYFFIKIKKIRSLNIKKSSLKKTYIFLKKDSPLLNVSLFHKILN